MTSALLKAFGGEALPIFTAVGGEPDLTPEETLRLSLYFNAMLRDAENRWRHGKLGLFEGSFEQFGGQSSL